MAYMGGLHFWWPKITGRLYPEWWARVAAALIFVGFNTTFFPQFVLGYLGMPRRYHYYVEEFQVLNVMSTAGASILAVGYLIDWRGFATAFGVAAFLAALALPLFIFMEGRFLRQSSPESSLPGE